MATHHNGIQELTLEEVMGDRFGRYSKYIIQERALPDIRDGLKPVQRRILFAMNEDGNTYDKGFRKSAKSVGNIMGNYHPHGDSSIYEALVRMSQDWKLRDILIEMHGNNGSMDGDPAAAMRYTEARLSKLSGELLADIKKETVDMVWNFDDTEKEPIVLPAKFPNLLVNGSTGISAGYATEIPTHNLGEVIDGTIYLLEHPNATLEQLMTYIPGPDFPTGGLLMGKDQIKKAYQTGKGKVVLRAKTSIEPLKGGREQIVITEIPYEVNKASLVKKMDEIRLNKKIDGISEVRDETDRTGLRIVVELKNKANAKGILNYLLKNTDLQINYNFNMVAIDKQRPCQVGLKHILESYIAHRKDVVLRRSRFDLNKAQNRAHIVAGLIKALSILDQVIQTIRHSENKKHAKDNLVAQYGFSEAQAEAIVTMQLYRLTNTDVTALEEEAHALREQVEHLQKILNDEHTLISIIKQELLALKKDYDTPRLTEIQEQVEEIKIETEVLVSDEQTMVAITRDGYMKRSSLRSVQSSGGAGEVGVREGDQLIYCQELNTRQHLYMVTNFGNVIYRPVHELPEMRWKDVGDHITQTITNLTSDEWICAVYAFKEIKEDLTFVFATKNGMIKQTQLNAFAPWRTYKTRALQGIKLKDNDAVIAVHQAYLTNDLDVLTITTNGYAVRYPLAEVSIQGAKATGVRSMNLKEDDHIVSMHLTKRQGGQLAIVTTRGYIKQLAIDEISELSRAKRGSLIIKPFKTNPHYIFATDIITSNKEWNITTANGREHLYTLTELPVYSRESNGKQLIDDKNNGKVIQVQTILNESESE